MYADGITELILITSGSNMSFNIYIMSRNKAPKLFPSSQQTVVLYLSNNEYLEGNM